MNQGIVRELGLQLPRAPAGIAERYQAFLRADFVGDIAEDVEACGHSHVPVDVERLGAMVFGTMDNEAMRGLYGPAEIDGDGFGRGTLVLAERMQQRCERLLADGRLITIPEKTPSWLCRTMRTTACSKRVSAIFGEAISN